MGVLKSGVFGVLRGKVGGTVGSGWKGINTLRAYVTPSDPQTPGQLTQREKFGFCLWFARKFVGTFIQTFWDPGRRKMSGFNAMVQINSYRVTEDMDFANSLIATGSIAPTEIVDATYVTDTVTIEWDKHLEGNQLANDESYICVYDENTDQIFYDTDGSNRNDESNAINIGTGRSGHTMHAWLFFYRGTGMNIQISPSTYNTFTA